MIKTTAVIATLILSTVGLNPLLASAARVTQVDRLELVDAQLNKTQDAFLSELTLKVQDHRPVSGVCDLNLSRLEYVEALRTLIVTFKAAQYCPRDDFGKRPGIVKWQLPSHLFQNSELKIIANDRLLDEMKIVKGQIIVKTKP